MAAQGEVFVPYVDNKFDAMRNRASMKPNNSRYQSDLPSTILFLLFCAVYYLRFGLILPISKSSIALIHDCKPFLLSLFAKL